MKPLLVATIACGLVQAGEVGGSDLSLPASRADFSGVWVLDPAATDPAPRFAGAGDVILTIEQTEERILIERQAEGKTVASEYRLPNASDSEAMDRNASVRIRWQGTALVIEQPYALRNGTTAQKREIIRFGATSDRLMIEATIASDTTEFVKTEAFVRNGTRSES